VKCLLCESKEDSRSFFGCAGGMYDMPEIAMSFETVCHSCWGDLCLAQNDLTIIAVQYSRLYHSYTNYKEFLRGNVQMNDNKFNRSNPIFRNGVAILVGNRRKEIEKFCK